MLCEMRFLLTGIKGVSSEDASADEGNGSNWRSNRPALSTAALGMASGFAGGVPSGDCRR